MSKCTFGQSSLECLGHIVSKERVVVDDAKIKAMKAWPLPTSLKGLRGFLGLTGYYRKFVKGYGLIAKPVTDILKNNKFKWTSTDIQEFKELKEAMGKTLVLALLDFIKPFVLEIGANGFGIGAILMQDGRPLAYINKAFPQEIWAFQPMRWSCGH